MTTNTCLHCGSDLPVSHGNVKYCPGKGCEVNAKKERQNKNYPVGDDVKKAIQKNRKLFLQVLGDTFYIELELLHLLKLGFEQDGYYKIAVTTTSQKKVFRVHDCYFHITSGNPQKIEIWRTSKN